jgi:TonB family protein
MEAGVADHVWSIEEIVGLLGSNCGLTIRHCIYSLMLVIAVLFGCSHASVHPAQQTPTAPECPAAPKRGWVDLRFDVSANGEVVDPTIVRMCPAGYFDETTLKEAVRAWKYQPTGTVQRDVRVHFSFDPNEKSKSPWDIRNPAKKSN